MWQEFSAGLADAPLWAQLAIGVVVAMFVAVLASSRVTRQRHAAAFARLAAAAGARTARTDEFTESFGTDVAGRTFDVRREFRSTARGGSYRGPTGHLLIASTRLSGSRWELHQVDISPGRRSAIFGAPPTVTGDDTFDARFMVRQDGVPVRDGWLDAPTRAAVTTLFDAPGVTGPVWVQEQRLQLFVSPWLDASHATLGEWLRRQADLAGALERTAGWRGPAA